MVRKEYEKGIPEFVKLQKAYIENIDENKAIKPLVYACFSHMIVQGHIMNAKKEGRPRGRRLMMAYTYKQLYAMFPDYVVLMTNRYMYEAKDRCARVLSYLMEYKLTQNKDGTLICAGPDKDKMIAVLRAHHINYVVSEFGKVTAKESYFDNEFDKYKALSANLPVQTMQPVTRNDSGPGKALVEPEIKREAAIDAAWLKDGVEVYHNKYGVGTVTSVVGHNLVVFFPTEDAEKKFVLPEALEKGYIRKHTE